MSLISNLVGKWRTVYPDVAKSPTASSYQAKFAEGIASSVQEYVDPQIAALQAEIANLRALVMAALNQLNNAQPQVIIQQVPVPTATPTVPTTPTTPSTPPPTQPILPPSNPDAPPQNPNVPPPVEEPPPVVPPSDPTLPINPTLEWLLALANPILTPAGTPVATITGSGQYAAGSNAMVSVSNIDPTYRFIGWFENGMLLSSGLSLTLTVPSGGRTVTANFSLTNSSTGTTGGSGGSSGGTFGRDGGGDINTQFFA